MANRFKIKRGSESPNNSADIENYELVYNYTDNELWTKHNGSVVKIASGNVGTVTNVVAGNGLTGGGTTSATLDVGAGTGISIAADSVSTNDSQIVHDNLSGFVANEHIDHSGVSILAGTGLTGGGTIASSRTLNVVGENGLAASANAIGLDLSPLSAVGVNNLEDEDLFAVEIAIGGAIKKLSASSLKTYIGGGTITSVSGMTNNNVLTASGSTTINGESQLTYNGAGLLEIHKDGSNAVLQLRSDDANTRIHFKEGSNLRWNVGYDAANNKFSFYDGATVFAIEDGAGANTLIVDSNSRVGIGTASPNTLLHLYSTSNTQLRLQTTGTGNGSNVIYQNGSASYTVGINSAEQFSFYSSQLGSDAGFINTNGNLYWNYNILLSANSKYIYSRDTNGALTRMLGMNSSNTTYIGPIDSYAGGRMYYGTSANMSGHNFYTGGTLRMKLDGSVLDLPNTGDWSYIKNNTNSGGLRFGTKDSGGTYADQIEISNTGNFVKLNENTTVNGNLTVTGTASVSSVLYGNQIDLTGELNFTGAGNKIIDIETLANSNYLLIRHHNPSGNLFEDALKLTANGGAKLYYNNGLRFETTAAGATLTGTLQIGSSATQSNAKISAISNGNNITFGHVNSAGYRSHLGCSVNNGYPFLAFYSEAGTNNNTFRTRGLKGVVLQADTSGKFSINHVANTSADNQSLSKRFEINGSGNITTGVWQGTAIANAYVADLPASKITSGTFNIARIPNGSGSGLDADLLDGLQGSSYWTKGGSWVGDLGSNGYSRVQGVSNGGGEFVLALKNGQLNTLIDGSYFAYEASSAAGGGFWSSYNSAYGNATGFKATGISTIEVKQQDGGTANLHVTQQISTDYGVRFNNGNTDFMFYNNTGDNLFYLRDLTNAQMLQTWTTSSTTIHKPLYVTGDVRTSDGTAANPAFRFTSDTNTGMYRLGDDDLGFSAGGSLKYGILNGLNRFYSNVVVGPNTNNSKPYIQYKDGYDTASTPSYSWYYDNGCGMGHPAGSTIAFSTGSNERLRINNSGLTVTGDIGVDGHVTLQSGHYFTAHNESSYAKYRMYGGSSAYAIGMYSGNAFGGLNDWAMTFTFNDEADRGFLWRDTSHSQGQGAMSLTTNGKLAVAHSTRIGYGESDTTTPGATYRLDVSGSIGATADVVAYISSDKRLKDNIKNIANPLQKLEKLNGVEFDWNDKQDLYEGHDIGVIAQEVEEVLPEIVDTRADGHKAVKYDRMVALLIEAVKEQQQQINELKEKLNG